MAHVLVKKKQEIEQRVLYSKAIDRARVTTGVDSFESKREYCYGKDLILLTKKKKMRYIAVCIEW